MDLNDYQKAARRTAIYAEHHRVIYPALGLASEAGKIKKVLRDQGGELAQVASEATDLDHSLQSDRNQINLEVHSRIAKETELCLSWPSPPTVTIHPW